MQGSNLRPLPCEGSPLPLSLTLPQDVISAKADGSVPSVATLKPRPEIVASEEDIAEMALMAEGRDETVEPLIQRRRVLPG